MFPGPNLLVVGGFQNRLYLEIKIPLGPECKVYFASHREPESTPCDDLQSKLCTPDFRPLKGSCFRYAKFNRLISNNTSDSFSQASVFKENPILYDQYLKSFDFNGLAVRDQKLSEVLNK